MCQAASMILLRDRVLIGRTTNSHSVILEQHGIRDTNTTPNFVKIEIVPPGKDYTKPLDTWKYEVDQDYLPEWYAPEIDKKRAQKALVEWYHEHIELQNTDTPGIMQTAGSKSTQTAGYRSTQTADDESTQKAGNESTQTAGDWSTQKAGDWSTQTAGDRATQTAGDRSTQKAGYRSTQKAGRWSTQTAGDRSTQTAGYESTQTAGHWAIQTAGDASTQKAGHWAIQTAGDASIQTGGVGTVQIIRYYDDGWKVKTRVITEETANKPYIFKNGDWSLVKER